MTGWLCARCGASWAPHIAQCSCSPPTATTNTIRLTPYEETTSGPLTLCCHSPTDRTSYGVCGKCGATAGVLLPGVRS